MFISGYANTENVFYCLIALLSQNGAVPDTFYVIDSVSAFNQLFLDEESSQLLTINTRKGLFRSKRLCFGAKTASSQFQHVMDSILSGIKSVMVRVDDVKSKLDAIRLAPRPKDMSQLRSFLGMLNYYSEFIKDFSSKMHPLYQLLSNKTEWLWSKECEIAFLWAKEVLSNEQVLVHYDPQKPLILSADASPYGIGVVLSHLMEDGIERSVEFELAVQKKIMLR